MSGTIRPAVVLDASWLVIFGASFAISRPDSPLLILNLWWLSAILPLACFLMMVRPTFRVNGSGATVSERCKIAGETFVDRGGSQLATVVLALGASPSSTAGLTAARALLAPINPFVSVLFNYFLPASRSSNVEGRLAMLRMGCYTVVGGVAAIVGVLLLIPDSLLRVVVGPTWSLARPFVFAVGATYVGSMLVQVGVAVGRGSGVSVAIRSARLLAAAGGFVPSTLVFLAAVQDVGAVYAVAIGSSIGALLFISATRRSILDGSST
jgi:hypothetical protein